MVTEEATERATARAETMAVSRPRAVPIETKRTHGTTVLVAKLRVHEPEFP